MRSIEWKIVFLGAAVVLLSNWTFGFFFDRVVEPNLYGIAGLEKFGGVTGGSGEQWAFF
jgi:hypothetical protein